MNFKPVGKTHDFHEGMGTEVRLGARCIAVYRIEDKWYAIKNICPHEGLKLHCAPPLDGHAVCRGHGWKFDLKDGRCVNGEDGRGVATYPVKVEDDIVFIDVG